MRAFEYIAPTNVQDACSHLQGGGDLGDVETPRRLLAGGTNLIDLMKEDVLRPRQVVDVSRLPLSDISERDDGTTLIGAMGRNAITARHPLVRERYPLLSAAILAGASPQIRNMATNGGNLLQRTRCYYFYDTAVACNKRRPGSGCPAQDGLARQLAILGASEHCIATHPSDMCVALAALDAKVHVLSERGQRAIPFSEFHRLPGNRPDLDTTIAGDELITHIELPPPKSLQCAYLKVRERASYAFALVSVAAAYSLDENGGMTDVRIALGGVAHKPWRDMEVEKSTEGQKATEEVFENAAAKLLMAARGYGVPGTPGDNTFKIQLARRAIVRALVMARQGELTNTGELGTNTLEDLQA